MTREEVEKIDWDSLKGNRFSLVPDIKDCLESLGLEDVVIYPGDFPLNDEPDYELKVYIGGTHSCTLSYLDDRKDNYYITGVKYWY